MSQPFEIITDPDVEARRKERAAEYGTWECGEAPIEVGGARAFNEGDPVPKSTVERLGLDSLGAVVKTGTFAEKNVKQEEERQRLQDEATKAQIKEATAQAPTARRKANAAGETPQDQTDAKGGNG